MQDKAKKAKQKRELVYKPYLKGPWHSPRIARKGLRILVYYLVFAFLYLLLGGVLQFENTFLRIVLNGMLVLICGGLLYMEGARQGETEVSVGEIAWAQKENGKPVHQRDLERCYHPMKGFFILLVGVALLLAISIPCALTAQKQVYALQPLPNWVSSMTERDEIAAPLAYYRRNASFGVMDALRIIVRLLVFPFANMATMDRPDAMLLVDRLSPLLICLPGLGFPLGYLTGPRSRAMVHGDIKTSNKRYQRRQKKAAKARRARVEKKNELI